MLKFPQTLERKLPLMMSGIFIVVFATILGAAYSALTRSARKTAQTSLSRATQELARTAERGIPVTVARYRAAANDSNVRAALRAAADLSMSRSSPTRDSATLRALSRVRLPNDSLGFAIELWSANGRRVAFVGPDRLKPTLESESRPTSGPPSFDLLA